MMIKRAEIGWKQEFDKAARAWTAKEARRRYPGLAGFWEFEDLLQEGAMVFAKCCQRYPRVNNAGHMMALYKTAYTRHLINIGIKVYKQRKRTASISADEAVEMAETASTNSGADVQSRATARAVLERMSTYNTGPLNCILAKFGGSIEAAAAYIRGLSEEERGEWLAAARG